MSEACCNWGVRRHLSPERQKEVKVRLRRVRGQVEGLLRMLEEDRACADILTQLASTIAALRGVQRLVLQNYLETCVRTAILEGRQDIYDEILAVFERYTRS